MKPTHTQSDITRREFFRSLLRGLLVGGAVAGVVGLAAKRSETCTGGGICRGCGAFEDCGLPQALSAKEVLHGRRTEK